MNSRVLSLAALCGLFAAMSGCAVPCNVAAPAIEHVVLVWLRDPGDETLKDRIVETARSFPAQIPGIVSLSVGAPLPSDRDVVDDSFDIALVMRFTDAAALAVYENHPVHREAVEALLAPNAERVVVCDVSVR